MVDRRLRYAVDNEVDSAGDDNAVLCARSKRLSCYKLEAGISSKSSRAPRVKGRVAVSHHDSSPHVSIRPIHLFVK